MIADYSTYEKKLKNGVKIMCNALMIMLAVAIVIMTILAIIVIITSNKHKKRIEEISLYQTNVSANIDSSIPEILNIIIDESFTDYKIKSLLPLNEEYINSEREVEIRKGLVNLVTARISSAALDKLSLFYNIENIADILADKIYIVVMNYVLEHNNSLQEQK